MPRPRMVANLIGRHARRARHVLRHFIERRRIVIVGGGEVSLANERFEPCAYLNRQLI